MRRHNLTDDQLKKLAQDTIDCARKNGVKLKLKKEKGSSRGFLQRIFRGF